MNKLKQIPYLLSIALGVVSGAADPSSSSGPETLATGDPALSTTALHPLDDSTVNLRLLSGEDLTDYDLSSGTYQPRPWTPPNLMGRIRKSDDETATLSTNNAKYQLITPDRTPVTSKLLYAIASGTHELPNVLHAIFVKACVESPTEPYSRTDLNPGTLGITLERYAQIVAKVPNVNRHVNSGGTLCLQYRTCSWKCNT